MLTFTRRRARELEQAAPQPEAVETAQVVETTETPESLETVVETTATQEPEQAAPQPEGESEVQDESLEVPAPESAPKRGK